MRKRKESVSKKQWVPPTTISVRDNRYRYITDVAGDEKNKRYLKELNEEKGYKVIFRANPTNKKVTSLYISLKKRPPKPIKYKIGDMVYSYQNPTVKRPIISIYPSENPLYDHKYRVQLKERRSKWMDERSMRKTKPRKKNYEW